MQPSSWRRMTLAVDVVTVQCAALLAVLWAGGGRITVPDAVFAAIYLACVVGLTGARQLRTTRLLTPGPDSSVEALRACSIGAMLAIATASLLGAGHPT